MIKRKKKPASSKTYNWRPNFRDFEALPDIRTVRAQLFVPAACITIAIVFVAVIAFREYRAMSIKGNIATLREEVESYDQTHNEKVQLNAEFMGIMRNLKEVVAFKEDVLVGSDFLLAVSSRLQSGMFLERVDYGEAKAVVEGNVQVPAEEASRIVDAYLKSLEGGDVLQGLFTQYKLTSLERDARTGMIRFRIEVTGKDEGGKK